MSALVLCCSSRSKKMEASPHVFSYRHSLFPARGRETRLQNKSLLKHFGITVGPRSSRCIEMMNRTTVAGALAPAGGFLPGEQGSASRFSLTHTPVNLYKGSKRNRRPQDESNREERTNAGD